MVRLVRLQRRLGANALAARALVNTHVAAAAGGLAWVLIAVVTFVLLKVLDRTVGLRVEAEAEHDGLDGVLHGESAYTSASATARET